MIRRRWFQFMGMLMLLLVGLCFYGIKDAGAIEFYGGTTYSVGSTGYALQNISAIATSDLDGDGDVDIITANSDSNTVSVIKNIENGILGRGVTYNVGSYPYSVFAADYDKDGDIDIAVANVNSNNVSILKNNGDGTYASAINYGVGGYPRSIFSADVDSDGDMDLVTANYGSNNISILKNNGDGTFIEFGRYTTGSWPRSVFAADMDGDGDNDLAVANYNSSNISILKNNGNGVFAAPINYSVGTNPYAVFAADIDSDGDADLATANYGANNVSVLKNNGSGLFTLSQNYGVGTSPESVVVADFNSDGLLDIAVANFGQNSYSPEYRPINLGGVSVLYGNGNGTFGSAINHVAGSNPLAITMGDFNADTRIDIAVSNLSNTISILFNQNGFQDTLNFIVGNSPQSSATGDFNNDGFLDIAVANSGFSSAQSTPGNIAILMGTGSGSFSVARKITVGIDPDTVVMNDFNSDGRLDLAVSNINSNTVSILLGRGDGSFNTPSNINVGASPGHIVVGDFNGDSRPDLIVGRYASNSNNIAVLLGTGSGSFNVSYLTLLNRIPMSLGIGDFNKDGILDLAVGTWASLTYLSENVTVLYGTGTGTFINLSEYEVGFLPSNIVVADFNEDGNVDIMTNAGYILFGTGSGFTPQPSSLAAQIAVDVNNDSHLDILGTDLVSGTQGHVWVRLGDGHGSFSPAKTFQGGPFPERGFAAGDFNKDGLIDVAVANVGSPTVSVLLNSYLPSIIGKVTENAITVGRNVQITTDTGRQNETIIAVDPTNASHLVGGAHDGHDGCAVYVSTNGGQDWPAQSQSSLTIPGKGCSDPVLTIDELGRVHYVGLFGGDLVLFTSNDGGLTFGTAKTIATGAAQIKNDKPWIVADTTGGPYRNRIYVVWREMIDSDNDQVSEIQRIKLVSSNDGGQSFSTPVVVSPSGPLTHFPVVAIGPDGEVYVLYRNYTTSALEITRSTDGGQTFGSVNTVANLSGFFALPEGSPFGTQAYGVMDVDRSNGPHRGNIHVAWFDYYDANLLDADIFLVSSSNGGTSWSSKTRVNDDTLLNNRDQFFPQMSIGPDGRVHIIWYDRRLDSNNSLIDVYYASSSDGGLSLSQNVRVTNVSFLPNDPMGPWIGDYIGLASVNSAAYALWTDGRNGNQDIYSAHISQSSGGGLVGVTMTLSGAASATVTTASNGTYSFTELVDGSYLVTPSLSVYTFTPVSRSVTLTGADVTGVDFSAVLIDSDNDGMTDTWETTNGLNPNDPTDATQDPDQDGLTNLREFQLNSNPNNKDSDGDGLPDGWEVSHNLIPTDNGSTDPNNGASGDPDGDGVNNLAEYRYNQDPQQEDMIQIWTDPATATSVSIGGRRSYEVVVRNARLIPDTVSISVTGIDPSWYTLSDTSLMLLAGEERRITLTVQLPEDCSLVLIEAGGEVPSEHYIQVKATPQTGIPVSASNLITVYGSPIITDITPDSRETLSSNQMAIHWMTDSPGTTGVFYRSESEAVFTQATGAAGTDHQVTLDNLVWNSGYDWYVRTQTACGVSQSAIRSAFISAGIIFENAPYEFFIERDYEQPAYITVRNIDTRAHNLLLTILNPASDLIAGFRGEGSVDQVISLAAGERKTVEVAFHAQDAMDPRYSLQFKIITDPESSRPVTSYAPVTVNVRQPLFNLQITQVSTDAATLTATYRITNIGDPVTDLMVTTDDASRSHILMQPAINHGELRSGGSVDVVLMADESLSGQLLARSALGEKSYPLSFGCGEGKSRFLVPVQPQTLCLNIRDAYCQNKPRFTLNFKTPPGVTQDIVNKSGFYARFYTKNPGYPLSPYDTFFFLNEKPMMSLLNQIPNGEKGVLFPTDYLNYALSGAAQNSIRVDTRHLNGGHYRANSDFMVAMDTDSLKVPVCAGTQTEAEALAAQRIAPLACNKDLSLLPECPAVTSVRTLDPATGQVKTRFKPGEMIRVEVTLFNPSLLSTGSSLVARFDDNLQDATPPFEVGESVAFIGTGTHTFHLDFTPAQESVSGKYWIEVEASNGTSCQESTGFATFVTVINDRDGDGLRDSIDPCPDMVDCDSDGLTDYEEVCYDGDCTTYDPYDPATNPDGTDTNAQDDDSDNDGYADEREQQRKSNPLDPSSFPAVTISGHVYGDRNGNGQYDAGEGIEGAELVLSPGLTCTQAVQNFVVTTSLDGSYQRANMPECIYEAVAGWNSTNEPPYTYRSAPVVIDAIGKVMVQNNIKVEENIYFTVLSAAYSDLGFDGPIPANDSYSGIINGVKNYYREVSDGLVTIDFNFLPLVTLTKPKSTYWVWDSKKGEVKSESSAYVHDSICLAIRERKIILPIIDQEKNRPFIVVHPQIGLGAWFHPALTLNCQDLPSDMQDVNGKRIVVVLVAEKEISWWIQESVGESLRDGLGGANPGSLGAWIHEIGHYLGYRVDIPRNPSDISRLAPDLYGRGNVAEWDLMAQGGDNSIENGNCVAPWGDRPSLPSAFTQQYLGWKHINIEDRYLGRSSFAPFEITIPSIETSHLGTEFSKVRLSDTDFYYLETRTNDNKLTYWDITLPEEALILYKATEIDKDNDNYIEYGAGTSDSVSLNIPGYRRCAPIYNTVSMMMQDSGVLKQGKSFRDVYSEIKVTTTKLTKTTSLTPLLESTVKFEKLKGMDYLSVMGGAIVKSHNITTPSPALQMMPLAGDVLFGQPDIDLHLFTDDKHHVGMNYVTNDYDIDGQGINTIGEQIGGAEWILAPASLQNGHFVISARDSARFLDRNPEFTLTNGGIEQFDVYGVAIDPTQEPIYKSLFTTAEIGPGEAIEVLFETTQNPDGTYSISITGTAPFVDAQAPVTTLETDIPSTPSGWYGNPVQVTLSATDDIYVALTEYSADSGATWQPYTSPLLLNTTGVHTLQYRSYDNFDHVEDIKTEILQLDFTAPVLSSIKDGGIYTTDPSGLSVTWSASDSDSGIFGYRYMVGTAPGLDDVTKGSSSLAGSQILSASLLDRQSYFICVKAANLAELESDQVCTDGITFLSPDQDPDQDGYTNQAEVAAESDPFNRDSIPGNTTLNLRKGFNLVSFPAEALYYENVYYLMSEMGGSSVISTVLIFDPVSQSFDEVGYNEASQPYGENILLLPKSGLVGMIVYAKQDISLELTSTYCPTWDLNVGVNLVGTPCAAPGMTAFQLLKAIGDETVISSVQRYNPDTGEFETAAYRNNVPVGVDFSIKPGEGYFITMHRAVSNIRIAAMNPPNNQWGECVTDIDCIITGCSGQICASEPVITTCEWLPEYACYHDPLITTCGCNVGQCGWAQTPELEACLGGTPAGDYVPGEIIVGFYDTVTVAEADHLIKSYNLTWVSQFPDMFAYWVKVLDGDPAYYISSLEESNIVLWAEVRGNPQGEPGATYILVQFNMNATEETAKQLINSFGGLQLSSIVVSPKWGVVNVPVG